MNTITNTSTYTVTDIKKTFEGFEADVRMIAMRTGKWTKEYAAMVCYDIIKLAEGKYLNSVDITLVNSLTGNAIRATRYTVNPQGKLSSGDRAGGNDWENTSNSYLSAIITYTQAWHDLPAEKRVNFKEDNSFKIPWSTNYLDTSYPNLTKEDAQTYASKGFELKKENYK